MDEFLKMDIFFFVTTAIVLIGGVLGCFLLYYLVKIVRDLREITRVVREEAKEAVADFSAVRADIKEGVHAVRENVEEGVASARKATQAVAGANLVRGVAQFFNAVVEEKAASKKRATRRRTSRKKDTPEA